MLKATKYLWTVSLCVFLFIVGIAIADSAALSDSIIRLHIVANSDSQKDQEQKILVRDAVLSVLADQINVSADKSAATQWLSSNLGHIEECANETLIKLGSPCKAKVSLQKKEFDTREYDTFTLPAGLYDSVCIEIGEAEGKNWWCVVFPGLCTTSGDVKTAAVVSGMDSGLVRTICNDKEYEIRFFLVDCIGKLVNFFHFS